MNLIRSHKWTVPVIVVLVTILEIASSQSTCYLPNNQEGSCVILDRCPIIKGILQKAPRPLPPNVANYIRSIHCGKINNLNAVCCISPIQSTNDETPSRVGEETDNSNAVDIQDHPNLKLLNERCGSLNTEKVAGGEKANLFEFPWMALLKYQTREGFKYLCGGSIINGRYILTAAHCISRLRSDITLYSVVLGEYDIDSHIDCVTFNDGRQECQPPKQEFLVEKIIPHKDYNRPVLANDIGLLRLASEISFSQEHIQPVCLPTTPELNNLNIRKVIVTGWGKTENQNSSSVLLKARISVVDLDSCRQQFPGTHLTEKQLCAQGTGITDACKGDSGGPLVFPSNFDDGPKYIQYGIVSAGVPGCGVGASRPGIYVRTQKYIDWILDNISKS